MKLKNLFYVLLTLMCVAAVPTMAQESTEATEGAPMVITLDEALQIALSDNPTVKVADKTIEKKQYAKKGSYAALWPEISASATYQRYIEKP
ncbi:MAG: TolC family protein, partial [Alistipes sp.]|nr:TolC family protein [Alistipes sp.]